MTDPTPPQPDPAAPKGDPPKGDLGERVGQIETEQARQGGILEKIERALTGKAAPPAAPAGDPPPTQDVAALVREGVEKIEAEKASKEAAERKEADAQAWRAQVDQHVAEHRPAEPRAGRMAKVQARLFGRGDAR